MYDTADGREKKPHFKRRRLSATSFYKDETAKEGRSEQTKTTGLEPATTGSTVQYSDQLSYVS